MDLVTVLSPHQDDAGFSLAITIRAITRAGHRVRVVNCFTVSEYAPHCAASSAEEVCRVRRHEDREFASRVGAGVELVDLGRLDAPLRLRCPVSAVRRLAVGRRERAEAAEIARELADRTDGVVLAPLGLGAHIDHLVASEAGVHLARAGYPVAFYEDLPYASEMRECCTLRLAGRAIGRTGSTPRAALIRDAAGTAQKRFAIEAYSSQVSLSQIQSVIGYGERLGGCERLWMTERAASAFPVVFERVATPQASGLSCALHVAADRAGAVYRRIRLSRPRGGVHVPEAS